MGQIAAQVGGLLLSVIAVLRIRTSRERRSEGPKYRIHGLFSAVLYTPYKQVSQILTDRSFFLRVIKDFQLLVTLEHV